MRYKVYLSHPIRGATGTPQEIAANCAAAIDTAWLVRHLLRPGYEVYVPAEQDLFPQIAMDLDYLTVDQVLAVDFEIIWGCDYLIADTRIPSNGVQKEIAFAREIGLTVLTFDDLPKLVECCETIKELGK